MEIVERVITYAQNNEDLILSAFFGDTPKGFYVDVGAFDPVHDSVTKYFYEQGWSGINIEPNRQKYLHLKKDRLRDINLNIGISGKPGKLEYREYLESEGLSTFAAGIKDEYSKVADKSTQLFEDRAVEVQTLANVFDTHAPSKIHFLKIDVEGLEFEVLKGNDWSKFRPEVLCIEANHILKDWHSMLKAQDYELVFDDGLNEYFVAKEAKHRADNFKYVEMVIGRETIAYKHAQEIDALTEERARLKNSLTGLIKKNQVLIEENIRLHHAIAQSQRFKSQLKGTIRAFDKAAETHIAKLARKPYKYPNVYPAQSTKSVSSKDLIKLAQDADRKAFTKGRAPVGIMFWTVSGAYLLIKRMATKIAKLLWRSMKKIKRSAV